MISKGRVYVVVVTVDGDSHATDTDSIKGLIEQFQTELQEVLVRDCKGELPVLLCLMVREGSEQVHFTGTETEELEKSYWVRKYTYMDKDNMCYITKTYYIK